MVIPCTKPSAVNATVMMLYAPFLSLSHDANAAYRQTVSNVYFTTASWETLHASSIYTNLCSVCVCVCLCACVPVLCFEWTCFWSSLTGTQCMNTHLSMCNVYVCVCVCLCVVPLCLCVLPSCLIRLPECEMLHEGNIRYFSPLCFTLLTPSWKSLEISQWF